MGGWEVEGKRNRFKTKEYTSLKNIWGAHIQGLTTSQFPNTHAKNVFTLARGLHGISFVIVFSEGVVDKVET